MSGVQCIGWGRVVGHAYEARYDEHSHPLSDEVFKAVLACKSGNASATGCTDLIYRGDICTRCGHRVDDPSVSRPSESGDTGGAT